MKRCIVLLIPLLFSAVLVFGSELPPTEDIDLSRASVHPAGTDSLLIRNVRIGEVDYALQLAADTQGRFRISDIIVEDESLWDADIVWDLASVRFDGADRFSIDGVLYQGEVLRGALVLDDEQRLILQGDLTAGEIDTAAGSRAEGILRLVLESEMTRQEQARERLRLELDETQQELEGVYARLAAAEDLEQQYIQEIESLIYRVEDLERLNYELEREILELERRLGDADRPVGDSDPVLIDEIRTLRSEIEKLRAELREPRDTGVPARIEPPAGLADDPQRVAALESELAELRERYAELRTANQRLEQRLISRMSMDGIIGVLSERFTEEIPVGEGDGTIGRWDWQGSVLQQRDPRAMFARYRLPAPQDSRPTLYRLQARATGSGWVGYGIHVQASGSQLRGYGHGQSLLIWITRDARAYGDDTTYLQVYTSFDDVAMRKVLHAAVEQPIDSFTNLEIMVEPDPGYVTVAADGVDLLRYRLFFPVEPGVEIALRSLNTADFRELEARTVPPELAW
ncbi:hypothetical protein [Spirochaeta africana]|uniref:Uncharacterized protein n=1 Tax=Spirochaeta africana (strain ATCC 700263 / DSM 8902 / Z-7692) TaxID=889378 RepID=H9UMD1_SPIAZ|nr:hypothetical protein [Spirochaeta africana]AFG38674.1 hypothetical protein Spiaf_2648 [Spirochaeta africana DSM 8902]